MSEAGRQAIREAVKRRWERVRAAAGAEGTNSADSTADSTPALASPKRGRRVNRTGNRKK